MTVTSPVDIKSKTWRFYEPKVAYADTSNPLALTVAGTTIRELEHLTRGIWTRSNLRLYNGTEDVTVQPISVETDEQGSNSDDTEIISAIIKTCRVTRTRLSTEDAAKTAKDIVASTVLEDEEEKEEGCISDSEGTTIDIDTHADSDNADTPPSKHGSIDCSLSSSPITLNVSDSSDEENSLVTGLSMECPSLTAWERRSELFSKFDKGCILDRSGWYEITPEAIALRIAEKLKRAISQSEKSYEVENDSHASKKLKVSDLVEDGIDSTPKVKSSSRPVLAAACGCGGEVIALARCLTDTRLTAVDIDPSKILRCEQNAKVYEVADHIDFIADDINEYAKTRSEDIRVVTEDIVVELPSIVGAKSMRHMIVRQKIVRPFCWCIMSPPWGGPHYRSKYCFSLGVQTFTDLVKMIQSCMKIADNLCLILPRNQEIDEVIHLACHGVPDGDRFIHVEFDRMSVRSDGYPKMLAVYLCRDASLLLSEPDLSRKAEFKAAKLSHDFGRIKLASKPKVATLRPPLPELMVSFKMLQKKRNAELRLDLDAIYNVVFCRFLLGYLEEPAYQIRVLESYLQLIGVSNLLQIIEETIRLTRNGGMKKRTNAGQSRTAGGLFFELLHQNYPEEFKILRKWRKRFIESLKQHADQSRAEPEHTTSE